MDQCAPGDLQREMGLKPRACRSLWRGKSLCSGLKADCSSHGRKRPQEELARAASPPADMSSRDPNPSPPGSRQYRELGTYCRVQIGPQRPLRS